MGMNGALTEMGTAEANHSVGFAHLQSEALVGVRYEAEVPLSMTPYSLDANTDVDHTPVHPIREYQRHSSILRKLFTQQDIVASS